MKELLTADINERYAVALNYRQIDRFMIQVLWWHVAFLVFLTLGNTLFRLGLYFPSPFSWRVSTLVEGAGIIALGLLASSFAACLYRPIHYQYVWRGPCSLSLSHHTDFAPVHSVSAPHN